MRVLVFLVICSYIYGFRILGTHPFSKPSVVPFSSYAKIDTTPQKTNMDDTKNLAYIAKVIGLQHIPGKGRIELATIKGWKCIVKKGELKVGDLAVYLALGSVPDFEHPNFAFLKEKGCNRIKTVKFRNIISQGLLGPLSWLTDRGMQNVTNIAEGDDVAAVMGVTKFIAAEELNQYANSVTKNNATPKKVSKSSLRMGFPACVPKTNAARLQNDHEVLLAALQGRDDVVITRKEDGCSCTFIFNNGTYQLCGRNFVWCEEDRKNTAAQYFQMQDQLRMVEKLTTLGRNIAIQGEICGPKINGNRMRLTANVFSVFDIYDIDAQEYLPYDALCELCAQLGLATVPLLHRGPAKGFNLTVEGYLQMADAVEYAKGVPGEGIVVKADALSPELQRVHFKTISNKYLLKYDV